MQETQSEPEDAADSSPSDPLNVSRRKELHLRTRHNLTAARAVLKDAANVAQWSHTLMARLQRRREQKTGPGEPGSAEQERVGDVPPPLNDPSHESKAAEAPTLVETVSRPGGRTIVVVRVTRSLDKITSPQFLSLLLGLDAEIEAAGPRERHRRTQQPVVADLRGLTRMDGTGVSALIQGRLAFARRGIRFFVLLERGSQPDWVFQAHGLSNIITHIERLDEL